MLQSELRGPVAPVGGPFLFMGDSRLLRVELGPVLARNLHRVVLRQFVFVVGPLEEATLSAQGGGEQVGGIVAERGMERQDGSKKKNMSLSDVIYNNVIANQQQRFALMSANKTIRLHFHS